MDIKQEYQEITDWLSQPDAYSKPEYAQKAKRQSELEGIVALIDQKESLEKQIKESEDILSDSEGEMAELAQQEKDKLEAKLTEVETKLKQALIPKDPTDEKNAIIEIRAGAGGDEASLFAGDLLRVYTRYAERNGYKIDLISESASEVGGFKEVIIQVKGSGAYGHLKYEAGVHRVQRIPATESSGRVHTSTVTVAILPEVEEADIQIKDQDIRVDVYRSSGHGGQSVNTTDSAVRITHIPTNIVVTCQDEKSQIKNKAKAMSVLRARLYAQQMEEKNKELRQQRKSLIGSGDRAEKIRTYNFPQDRITDHRIKYSRSNISGAMDGDISDLIDELQEAENQLHDS